MAEQKYKRSIILFGSGGQGAARVIADVGKR